MSQPLRPLTDPQPTASAPSPPSWRDALHDRIQPELEREIDIYETQLELKRQGKIDDRLFAETRLRRGVYGQRYDNGQRHDGRSTRALAYPSGDLLKGPSTIWDAPGMLRIKIPFGALDAEQMEVLAELAEEYSDSICHVTTRQDFQLHFIHIDDTPDIMRRLAAVGITTREACGNSVRNVTACPISGVCRDEAFDTTPYARALAYFLLGHKDTQDFGRKFKISFSGCAQHACALANMHDLGMIARTRERDGRIERGFEVYVGGGLGAVPHQAKLLSPFVPEAELLPTAQAVCRVFARLGEKRNRARARIKFLVASLGIEELRRLVEEERAILPEDDRWTAFLQDLEVASDGPLPGIATTAAAAVSAPETEDGDPFEAWLESNVYRQRQGAFATATVSLPLGDLTAAQLRALADVARRYNGGRVRTSVEQNLVLRWIHERDLPALHRELSAIGLGAAGASTLVDITACPGTDTCKLGISSSRGLAAELRRRVQERGVALDQAVRSLRIKISGCFNSCGQHHVADIGFYGVSRKKDGRTVPHFQVVLGGQWSGNAGAYGLAVVAVPSKRIPEVVDRITELYVREKLPQESFQELVKRVGKGRIRALLDDLTEIPDYERERGLYSDWRDPREYTLGDMGVGECAGEVVPVALFGLQASERQVFEAQLLLDEGEPERAIERSYRAMLQAAKALARTQDIDIPDDPTRIVQEFRTRFVDTGLFSDPYAGAKFARYLFHAHEDGRAVGAEEAHRRIEEAQLFIEAAYTCHDRLAAGPVAAAGS